MHIFLAHPVTPLSDSISSSGAAVIVKGLKTDPQIRVGKISKKWVFKCNLGAQRFLKFCPPYPQIPTFLSCAFKSKI